MRAETFRDDRRLHVSSQRFAFRRLVILAVTVAGVLGTTAAVRAQALKDVQTPDTPLVLKVVWPNFRFGSKAGEPYSDKQFPVAAVDELSNQGVPVLADLV